jgi:hypothetical protein
MRNGIIVFGLFLLNFAYAQDANAVLNAIAQLIKQAAPTVTIAQGQGKCVKDKDVSLYIDTDSNKPALSTPKGGKAKLWKLPASVLDKVVECK